MKLLNLIALCFCTLLMSCGGEPAPDNNTVAINATEGSFVLSIKDFETKLKATENAQLIDVRTPEEFAAGALPNALNINFYNDNFKAEMDKLDKTRPVFVYCAKGGRSGEASEICKGMGFKLIYDMEGGYMAWTAK